jgi:hypothetical protein
MEAWVMARSFNGTSDKVAVANGLLSAYPFTMAGWVNLSSSTNTVALVVCGINGVSTYSGVFLDSSTSKVDAQTNVSGVSFSQAVSASGATVGVWAHCAATFTNSTITAYLNGGNSGSGANTVNPPSGYTVANAGARDANSSTANFLAGSIADTAIWTVALTASEISALANGARPNTIRPANLIFWWPLGGIQSPEPDLSGKANNGTLTGTAPAFGPPIMQFTPRWPQLVFSAAPPPPVFILMPQIVT